MRLPVRLGILAFLWTLCGVLAAQNEVTQITSALRAGQFDTALQLLQARLEQTPKSAQLWTLRGIALSGKGDRKDGLSSFRHALGISPDYLPALEGAAQIEYEDGGKDAASLLQRILAISPNDPTSNAMLAVLDYRRGECSAAVPHFERSGSLVDSQPGALQAFGECLVKVKEILKAIAVFERALAESGGDTVLRCRLAAVQMMVQRPKDAIATLQPLLQSQTSDADLLALAASAYEADGNTPEAVRILRQAIVLDPHNVDLYVDFANISLDHQSYQVGVDMVNAGLAAELKAAPLYVARGVLYVQMAQYDKAEADFAKADMLDPRQSIGSAAEGLAVVEKNEDPDQTLATVRSKLAKAPSDPFLLYLQAEVLAQRGPEQGSPEFRQAMESAKKAVMLRPSLTSAHDILAKLYLQAGQNDAAIEQSRKALTSDPKDQTAIYHLIQALRKSGRTEDIPNLLKRLAELRMEGTKEEAEHNRYKLVEEKPPTAEQRQR
jgi:tetratricopeptide (TPR) repeat protein